MRRYLIGVVSIAIAGLAFASGFMNFRFGWEMGKATSMLPWFHDGYLYGVVSVLLDIFKIALPIFVLDAITAKGRSWLMRATIVAISLAFWAPITFFSFSAGFGSAVLGRSDSVGTRSHEISKSASLAAQKRKLLDQNPWTGTLIQWKDLPSSAIEEQIEAHKVNRLWMASDECKGPSNTSERTYCQTFFLMKQARATAIQGEQNTQKLSEIDAQLSTGTSLAVADPQAKAYSDLTGYSEDAVRSTWAGFFALFLESIPNLGPALLVMYAGIRIVEPKKARMGEGSNIALSDTALVIAPAFELTPVDAPEPMKELAPPKEAKPKAKPAALKAVAGQSRTVLPFLPAGVSPKRLTSIPDFVTYVTDGLREGKHRSCDIYKEVERVARANGFQGKVGTAHVGKLVRRALGNECKRGGPRNLGSYEKRKAPREVKIA